MNKKKLEERADLRSLYLRLLRGWKLPLLTTVICAVAALAIYVLATTVFGPGRLYRAEAKLYIHFSKELADSAYPYYNDYTWRDLITTDELLEGTLHALESTGYTVAEESDLNDMGSRIISAYEVKGTVYATLPSDIRLMVVECTNHDPVTANAVAQAVSDALVQYGEAHAEFDSIEPLSLDAAQIVTYADRRVAAIVTGAVIGLLVGLFLLFVKELFHDGIYSAKELAERTKETVAGTLLKEDRDDALSRMLTEDLRVFLQDLNAKGIRALAVIGADEAGAPAGAEQTVHRLTLLSDGLTVPAMTVCAAPGTEEGALERIKAHDAALLAVRFGEGNAALTEHALMQCKNAGVNIAGMLLTDADARFLKNYYRTE